MDTYPDKYRIAELEPYERDALRLLSEGEKREVIAEQLSLSLSHVNKMLSKSDDDRAILPKLGAKTLYQAVALYAAYEESRQRARSDTPEPDVSRETTFGLRRLTKLDLERIENQINDIRNAGRQGKKQVVLDELPKVFEQLVAGRPKYRKKKDIHRFNRLGAKTLVGLLLTYIATPPSPDIDEWSSDRLQILKRYREDLRDHEDDEEDYETALLLPTVIAYKDKSKRAIVNSATRELRQIRSRLTTDYAKSFCYRDPAITIAVLFNLDRHHITKTRALEELREEVEALELLNKDGLTTSTLAGFHEGLSFAYTLLDEFHTAEEWLSTAQAQHESSVADKSWRPGVHTGIKRTEFLLGIRNPETNSDDISNMAESFSKEFDKFHYPQRIRQTISALRAHGNAEHSELATELEKTYFSS